METPQQEISTNYARSVRQVRKKLGSLGLIAKHRPGDTTSFTSPDSECSSSRSHENDDAEGPDDGSSGSDSTSSPSTVIYRPLAGCSKLKRTPQDKKRSAGADRQHCSHEDRHHHRRHQLQKVDARRRQSQHSGPQRHRRRDDRKSASTARRRATESHRQGHHRRAPVEDLGHAVRGRRQRDAGDDVYTDTSAAELLSSNMSALECSCRQHHCTSRQRKVQGESDASRTGPTETYNPEELWAYYLRYAHTLDDTEEVTIDLAPRRSILRENMTYAVKDTVSLVD